MSRLEFYQSKAWKDVRKAYALSKHCQCERCGRYVYVDGLTDYLPKDKRIKSIVHHKEYLNDTNYTEDSIALDENNLELLCIDCHNQEHFLKATRKNLMFDVNGNLVPVSIGRGVKCPKEC